MLAIKKCLRATPLIAMLLVGAACSGSRGVPTSPPSQRSEPPTQASTGETLGADEVSTTEKLQTGPRIGTQGVQPAARPTRPGEAAKNPALQSTSAE